MEVLDYKDLILYLSDKISEEDIESLIIYNEAISKYTELFSTLTMREIVLEEYNELNKDNEAAERIEDNIKEYLDNEILNSILRPDLSELDWLSYTKYKIYMEITSLKNNINNIINKYN